MVVCFTGGIAKADAFYPNGQAGWWVKFLLAHLQFASHPPNHLNDNSTAWWFNATDVLLSL